MINSLEITTISHFGIEKNSPMEASRKAGLLFSRTLSRASWRSLWFKLTGRKNSLKELPQGNDQLVRKPAGESKIVNIPLNKIVGSEGRTKDFDSAFNPLTTHIRDRWIGIAAARRRGAILPPVELIQVGKEYYVRDGNHRVSVAKAVGQIEIEAQVVYALA